MVVKGNAFVGWSAALFGDDQSSGIWFVENVPIQKHSDIRILLKAPRVAKIVELWLFMDCFSGGLIESTLKPP